MRAPEILDKAAQHMRDRASTYDKPEGERSMAQTVAVFNLFHGTALTETQGWHFMQILKDVRLFARDDYHADSAEDCTAYSALKAEALAKPKEQENKKETSDHWVNWTGGINPVPGKIVNVKVRTGEVYPNLFSNNVKWSHENFNSDVLQYKVIK